MPALDGLRAVAVAAVVAFHLGLHDFQGGYLGVDIFFVISGFLITSLLVEERKSTGRIHLAAFWGRRARRLLPGVVVVVATLAVISILRPAVVSPYQLRSDGLGALFYYANWHFMFSRTSAYFAASVAKSPLLHTWSLAIEEQFYLVWPFLLFAVVGLRKPFAARRNRLLAVCGIGAFASASAMALLYWFTSDTNAVYYGTETRAFELLTGAFLAALLAGSRRSGAHAVKRPSDQSTGGPFLHAAGLAAAGVIGWLVFAAAGHPAWVFEGGLFLCCILTAIVIASIRLPGSPLGRLLGLRPVRWIGTISYEIYLWHWPVIVLLGRFVALRGAELDLAETATSIALAAATYYAIGRPIRHMSFRTVPRRAVVAAVFSSCAVLVASTVSLGATAVAATAKPPSFVVGRSPSGGGGQPDPGGHGLPHGLWDSHSGHGGSQTTDTLSPAVGTLDARNTKWSASHPIRVYYVGDSLLFQANLAITGVLEATGAAVTVGDASWPGWGLTTTSSTSNIAQGVSSTGANLVICLWSMDDTWLVDNGTQGPALYQTYLDNFVQQMLDAGASGVVLLQQPPLPPPTSEAAQLHYPGYTALGQQLWSQAAERAAKQFPGHVVYLPVASSLLLDGKYSAWLPDSSGHRVRARQLDGFHFCAAGAGRYAAAVYATLDTVLPLPTPAPSWWNGSWSLSTYFGQIPGGQPAGQCPNDQPP
jgi:peptidoglycan/LPS O-acetylase OafA/YrhL